MYHSPPGTWSLLPLWPARAPCCRTAPTIAHEYVKECEHWASIVFVWTHPELWLNRAETVYWRVRVECTAIESARLILHGLNEAVDAWAHVVVLELRVVDYGLRQERHRVAQSGRLEVVPIRAHQLVMWSSTASFSCSHTRTRSRWTTGGNRSREQWSAVPERCDV